jgi:hypothetical protein
MGTLSWSVTESGRLNKNVQSTRHTASGTFTTSTAAANITSLSVSMGDVIVVHADEAMRIRFGATAATASTGHYIPAGIQREFEVGPGDTGAVSVIDVA